MTKSAPSMGSGGCNLIVLTMLVPVVHDTTIAVGDVVGGDVGFLRLGRRGELHGSGKASVQFADLGQDRVALMLEDEGVIGGVIDDQRGINGAVMDDQRVVVVVGCSDNCPNEHGGGGTSAKELSAIKQSQRTSLVD